MYIYGRVVTTTKPCTHLYETGARSEHTARKTFSWPFAIWPPESLSWHHFGSKNGWFYHSEVLELLPSFRTCRRVAMEVQLNASTQSPFIQESSTKRRHLLLISQIALSPLWDWCSQVISECLLQCFWLLSVRILITSWWGMESRQSWRSTLSKGDYVLTGDEVKDVL